MLPNYSADAEQIVADIAAQKKKAEQLCIKKMEFLHDFVKKWYWRITEETIQEKPDIAAKLGKERLGEMKKEINELICLIPENIQKELNADDVWIHRQDLTKDEHGSYNSTEAIRIHAKAFEKRLQKVQGKLGKILNKFGFLNIETSGEITIVHGNWGFDGDEFRYSKVSFLEGELGEIQKQYSNAIHELASKHNELAWAEAAKKRADAKDLWDSA